MSSNATQWVSHTRIEIVKQSLHFAAAHFTIFSATERENLHGHNFQVRAVLDCKIGQDGIVFDYNIAKDAIQSVCDSLDEHMLLPELSPHLEIHRVQDGVDVRFAGESMSFLSRDVVLLPIRNTTVEELSQWFLCELLHNPLIQDLPIQAIELGIASGSGQWGVAKADIQ